MTNGKNIRQFVPMCMQISCFSAEEKNLNIPVIEAVNCVTLSYMVLPCITTLSYRNKLLLTNKLNHFFLLHVLYLLWKYNHFRNAYYRD